MYVIKYKANKGIVVVVVDLYLSHTRFHLNDKPRKMTRPVTGKRNVRKPGQHTAQSLHQNFR